MIDESIERIACRLALASLAPLLPLEIQPDDLFGRFYELCQDQQRRLDNRLTVCPVPLWVVALLNHYGYVVDLDSAVITGWPRPLPDWLPIDTDLDGRIVRWPVEKPASLSVQSSLSQAPISVDRCGANPSRVSSAAGAADRCGPAAQGDRPASGGERAHG